MLLVNVMGRRVVCHVSALGDVRRQTIRAKRRPSDRRRAPGISAGREEPRGLEEPRRLDRQLDSGLGTRSTK